MSRRRARRPPAHVNGRAPRFPPVKCAQQAVMDGAPNDGTPALCQARAKSGLRGLECGAEPATRGAEALLERQTWSSS